ncbi:MAG: hypothetical protein IJX51_06840 [Clostridia bacterium]|nr:hypothetical protein [Clostridia bacterium]
MKKTLKCLLCLFMMLVILTSLSGCGILVLFFDGHKIDYPYLNSREEIVLIEIIRYDWDNEDTHASEIITTIENTDEFLDDFEDVDYYDVFMWEPQGIEDGGIAIKFTYSNGEYEINSHGGQGRYNREAGCYYAYTDNGYFDKEQFRELIYKWANVDIDDIQKSEDQTSANT